ncbi:MAG TPA: exosortase/archaeosortase family protein, partial [Candidatus Dormibacteraeota bacterium]|nr:exosortase/archaeosortase family protein [Candidatus Dormibacteraeota bacterium]
MNTTIIAERDSGRSTKAHIAFGALVIVSTIIFWRTLSAWFAYSLHNPSGSHIVLIPFVSAFLIFRERQRIFSSVRPSMIPGIGMILVGAVLYWTGTHGQTSSQGGDGSLFVSALAVLLIWVGGFVSAYGVSAAREAAFPLLFLLLMIPLPERFLNWTIELLQRGSTEISYLLFNLVGVPALKQGFVISVPGISIEVAAECSGIRSSLALLITCLLAAHLYLRTPWKIAVFILLVLPLSIIKNGIRIVTLTLLSLYVDPRFLTGSFHRDGGFVFFLLALLLLFPVFLALERSEGHRLSSK